jgi:hypothetical protein
MPLLDFRDIVNMLRRKPVECHECKHPTHQNYCRECDEFYQIGHASDCTLFAEHAGHRIYPVFPIVPFTTTCSDWAIYLDPLQAKHCWIEHAAIVATIRGNGQECPHDLVACLAWPTYQECFMAMGQKALKYERSAHLDEAQMHAMHFNGNTAELRIGHLGGQLLLFTPKMEARRRRPEGGPGRRSGHDRKPWSTTQCPNGRVSGLSGSPSQPHTTHPAIQGGSALADLTEGDAMNKRLTMVKQAKDCQSPPYLLAAGRAGPPVAKDQHADCCCDKHAQMEQENDDRRWCRPVVRTEYL